MTTTSPTQPSITAANLSEHARQRLERLQSRPHPRARLPSLCCVRAHRAGLLPELPAAPMMPARDVISGEHRCVLCGLSFSFVKKEEEDCWCHHSDFKPVLDTTKWPGGSLWDKTEEERARSFRERKESERKSFEKRKREEEARQKRAAERKAAEDARLINRVFNFLACPLSILFHPFLIFPWLALFSYLTSLFA